MSVRRLDLVLGAVVLALAAAVALVPFFVAGGDRGVDGSAESTEPEGRRALFLVLEELGFAPEIWNKPPGTLPHGEHIVWAAEPPMTFGEFVARDAERAEEAARGGRGEDDSARDEHEPARDEAAPAPRDAALPSEPVHLELHDLARYRDFAEQGGTIVLPRGAATRAFLGRVDLAELGLADVEAVPSPPFAPLDLPDVAPDSAFAAPVGSGRIVLVSGDGLSNEELGASDGALRAVRLVEALDGGGRLLIDEYALGRWQPDTAVGLALSRDLRPSVLHALLLLLLLAWRASYPRAFPRDPEPLALHSPLSRARASAALFERARRFDVLASWLRRGVLRRLGGRALARGAEPAVGTTDGERAWREWAASVLPVVSERTAVVSDRAGAETSLERWRAALLSELPTDARGLEALGAELRALESTAERGASVRGRGHLVRARLARPPVSGIVPGR